MAEVDAVVTGRGLHSKGAPPRPNTAIAAMLPQFLSELARAPLVWGVHDCMMNAADWCIACGHPDPAADFRGAYTSAEEADDVLSANGGIVALMQRQARFLGLRGVQRRCARDGDLGAVRVMTRHRGVVVEGLAAGIRIGARWALFNADGVMVERAAVASVWRMAPGPNWI